MKILHVLYTVLLVMMISQVSFAQQGRHEIVKLIYFLPNDRSPQPDIDQKINNMIKRCQTFYADQMENYGFGRKTFEYEADSNGDVVVHHVIGQHSDSHYLKRPDRAFGEIDRNLYKYNKTILFVVIDYSKKLLPGNACGAAYSGKRILLPAAGSCFNWITAAHEIGHTLLLPHDFREGNYLMSYGATNNKILSECAAYWLDVHPYFNPLQGENNTKGKIEMLSSIAYLPDNIHTYFELNDLDGLHLVRFLHGPTTIYRCYPVYGEKEIVKLSNYSQTLKNNRIKVQAVDSLGGITWGKWYSLEGIEPDKTFDISLERPGLDRSIIGHWSLDEASGKYAFNTIGQNNIITFNDDVVLIPNGGRIGGALFFNGISTSDVENGEDLINGLDAFTLSLWVKSDEINTDSGFIFAKKPNGKDEVFSVRYDAEGYIAGGKNVIKAAITTTGGSQVYESAGNLQTRNWQHITLTWESGSKINLYINGQLDEPTYNSEPTLGTLIGADRFSVGKGSKDKNRSWKGYIDDVRLYNRVLTGTELAELPQISRSRNLINGVNLTGVVDITDDIINMDADIDYNLSLTNTGNTDDNIGLSVMGDVTVNLSQSEVFLRPGESSLIQLKVPRSIHSAAGAHFIGVTATSFNDPTKTAKLNSTISIRPIHGVTVTGVDSMSTLLEVATDGVHYPLTVINNGNVDDIVQLDVSGDLDVSLSPNSVLLSPNQSAEVTVTIPGYNFITSGAYPITINATSIDNITTSKITTVVYVYSSIEGSLQDGLISHWTFDEGHGNTTTDISNNNRHLQRNGAADWATPNETKIGNSAYHNPDGKSGSFSLTDASYLNGLDSFSICLWIKSAISETDQGFILGSNPDGQDEKFSFRYDKNGFDGGEEQVIKTGITTTEGIYRLESSGGVQTTDWQHLIFMWRSGEPMRLYINGELDIPSFTSSPLSGTIKGIEKLLIGKGSKDTNRGWRGIIDDVRIYNRTLAETEIQAIVFDELINPPVPYYSIELAGVGPLTRQIFGVEENIEYTLQVTNLGNTIDTINLTSIGDVKVNFNKNSVTLLPKESVELTMTIIADDLKIQKDYEVKVIASSQGDKLETAELTTLTTHSIISDILIEGVDEQETLIEKVNDGLSYTLHVSNIGNATDTIILTTSGDIKAELSESTILLAPKGTIELVVTISSDELDRPGKYELFIIATSTNDMTKGNKVEISIKVKGLVWDLDDNGRVDILDLVMISSKFGQTGEDLIGDINRDGVVDILDLVEVASHFGETIEGSEIAEESDS
ncbi:hypothetical protein JT359_05110 [Candidatus Poribacteria bacterium]|nr:hypothetical protein [Candidatus Poribacteria bacterium]